MKKKIESDGNVRRVKTFFRHFYEQAQLKLFFCRSMEIFSLLGELFAVSCHRMNETTAG
jgi:hypothetical protein